MASNIRSSAFFPLTLSSPWTVKVDLLTTLPVSPTASHRDRSMSIWAVFGKLKPGISASQSKANLETLFAASKADAPIMFRSDTKLVIDSLQHHRIGDAHLLLFVLSGAVAFLLFIACANVANLLLARWSSQSRELAVRAAIGAGRNRLIRQLFTETALLTIAGCALGLMIVVLSLSVFVHYAGDEIPRLSEVTVDARVLLIAAITSCITTLLFGWLPALRAGSVDIQSILQSTGRLGLSAGYGRMRRVLVASEIAIALILLSGASLLLETVWHMENDRLGFQPEHVLTVSLELRGSNLDTGNQVNLADDILHFIQQLPGTEATALTQCTPLRGGPIDITFSRSDRPVPEAFHRGDGITVCGTGPSYLTAAKIPLIRGRFFTEGDFPHPRTLALINEAAVRAYFPGEDPLSRRILKEGPEGEWKTVIGIVSDTKNHGLRLPSYPQAFVNDLGLTGASELLFIVRTAANQNTLTSEVREKLRTLDPGLFAKFETLNESMAEMSSGARFNGVLLASFASLAFIIAIIGVYGLFAFAVIERTQEIGIRMAVGARPSTILGLVLGEGAWLVMIGSLVGVSGALAATRYMKSLLYDVSASDPRIYAATFLAIAVAALLATWVPAWRASSIDPVIALRHE
jgi:putative ABC transport system permease protein